MRQDAGTAAAATAAISAVDKKVVSGQGVAVNAMRLARVLSGRPVAAKHILAWRYRLKMIGIDAGAITAKVVDLKAAGDRAVGELVSDAVDSVCARACAEEQAVALGVL